MCWMLTQFGWQVEYMQLKHSRIHSNGKDLQEVETYPFNKR